jgi:hypothetical protein
MARAHAVNAPVRRLVGYTAVPHGRTRGNPSIQSLGYFQVYKRPPQPLKGKEGPVQFFSLFGQKAGFYSNSRLPQRESAFAVYPRVGVCVRNNNAPYSVFDDKPRTGRLMLFRRSKAAGFKSAVQVGPGGVLSRREHGFKSLRLRVKISAAFVPAFPQNAAAAGYNGAHQGVGGCFACAPPREG